MIEGKVVSNVAGSRKDMLAWRLKCHMRRRKRLAGLQRPHGLLTRNVQNHNILPGHLAVTVARCSVHSDIWCSTCAAGRPVTPAERAARLRCVPLVVLSNNSEVECPDLFQSSPNSLSHARVPPNPIAFLYTSQTNLRIPALTRCANVSAMATLHSWDVAHDDWESSAEMPMTAMEAGREPYTKPCSPEPGVWLPLKS